jgi:hypothetical protein
MTLVRFFCIGVLAMIPTFSDTIDYSLTGQWSNTANPNGPWTYREGNDALPLISAYSFGGTVPGFTSQPAWAPSNTGGNFLPVWFQSSQTSTPSGFEAGSVLSGDVLLHSTDSSNGSGEGVANVTWTSPSAGVIDISGGVSWVRSLGRTNDFSIFVGGVLIADGAISDGIIFTRSNPLQFASGLLAGDSFSDIPVSAGEVVELAVMQAPNSPFGEISDVSFQINETTASAIPEPSGLALFLGLALWSAGVLRHRAKRV